MKPRTARTRRADKPLPVQKTRALSAAEREDALGRLLAGVEERLEREQRRTA